MAFKDANSREWTITLTAPLIGAVRDECDLDLIDLSARSYDRMNDDPCLLVDVLRVLCRAYVELAAR